MTTDTDTETVAVDENLLKTLYIIYRDPSMSCTRSHMTRHMINKGMPDIKERDAILAEAAKQKLIVVGRRIQMGKGGANPITYKLTQLGIETVRPHTGDDDLEEHEIKTV